MAVSKKESDIRIINEPLKSPSKVPSVFLVETGEASTPRETLIAVATATTKYENTGAPPDVKGRVFLVL